MPTPPADAVRAAGLPQADAAALPPRRRAKRLVFPERGHNVRVEPRDLAILDFIAANRFVSSKHIVALFAFRDVCAVCRGSGVVSETRKEDGPAGRCSGCACALCHGQQTHVVRADGSRACPGETGMGRSPRPFTIVKRLGELFSAQLIYRPPQQLDYYRGRVVRYADDGQMLVDGGSEPMVYGLGDAGARVLIDHLFALSIARDELELAEVTDAERGRRAAALNRLDLATQRGRIDWVARNAAVSKPFLRHTLAVAGLDVALRLAQRSHPHITLLHRQALHDAIAASHRPLSRGFGLTAMIRPAGGSERAAKTVVTDLPVGLAFPDGSRRHFLFEWDTGSESIAPQSPAARGSANIVDKLVTYQTAWTAREHAARYGWQSFAVPIITASPKRAQNILALIRSHDLLRNSRLFLVTDRASLAASPDLFAHAWQTRTGTPAALVPPELLSALPL